MVKKRVLIITATRANDAAGMNWYGLRDALRDRLDPHIDLDVVSLTDMVLDVSNSETRIVDGPTQVDIASYDKVLIRNVGKNREIAIAIAHYLRLKNIEFTDMYLDTHGFGKLSNSFLRRRHNLSTPRTLFGKPEFLLPYLERYPIDLPVVVKADNGKKGRHNYLVQTLAEMGEIIAQHPDQTFIVQQFIPNDGDYRVLVMGGQIRLVIYRTASNDTHLTNTSQGGSAELVDTTVFSKDRQDAIVRAAAVEAIDVAGVDIVIDKTDGSYYFLEVNLAPQIGTGAFVDEKIDAYAQFIEEMIGK